MESSTADAVHNQHITEVASAAKSPAYSDALAKECVTLTRYLITEPPSHYVIQKYCDAHRTNELFVYREVDSFDQLLLKLAKVSPFLSKMVDVYTAFFYRRSIFRAKIVLLMAILESCAPSYVAFEEPDANGILNVGISVLGQGIFFVLTLLLSLITLFPVFLLFSVNAKLFGRS
jgi:hypothetical protein